MLIGVHVPSQTLRLKDDSGRVLMDTRISTGRKGVGEVNGSEQTPRGWHKIGAKIGAGQPENAVFVARRPTGELYSPEMRASYPNRDWILTRSLWLSGLEPGRILLTSLPCQGLGQLKRIVARYALRRWIEQYHKALKSGAGIEESQLERGFLIENLLAVLAVLAVRLVNTQWLARNRPDATPASIRSARPGSSPSKGHKPWLI